MNTTAPSQAPDNTHTRPATIGERHRDAYARAAQPAQRQRPSLAARVRPWLLAGAAGLAIGAAVMGAAAYRVMPIQATAVERVFADVDGDGALDFIVSGWIVYGPKAPGQ